KLPSGTVEALLEDVLELRKVLEYHVVAQKIVGVDLAQLSEVTTTQGTDLKIDSNNGVKVNDAIVVTPDVSADNGVIHVIDQVLIPQ
ncbi:fasciclin domain-containing protein, partial [Nostoc sp.]|uniref:fasciclin domain-containing protein n=1 Tax=Nostoc sp. TaxID=1180 RepID=UPI002FF4A341